ncbi:Eco57I restriction-modification methylase domain-containing protein [Ralstonia solanacearum]|uniref:Eco57I restriction-modification methylase domain-containing protein n=1 Tax=Ralstonia solanacearum TaxID=305 RepID=UPI001E631F7F|nr:Eco57I restriction-modification methylase domain-containing protein [Ralstonia solanacearum]MCL9824598.1 Eco57I restriction-modification methylase domain-containing protein [Ralstonia solanacearum]MCL9830025.1 Eco57I restriction-modification methylase domain-containing protein [Ralstonia solanacearum]MCL9834806.1 Eco57I restriction-modification methylase domain-containing protein [Ralstonia solanacearum]
MRQPSFPDLCPVTAAVKELAHAGGIEERGAIFTRCEVVEFILDLVGYTTDKPLHKLALLEPSFGDGDFLLPVIDRLLSTWKSHGETARPLETLAGCIRAVELHRDTFSRTYAAVVARLVGAGIAARTANKIADHWLLHGDFLLTPLPGEFDVVIGNPPYVRQEMIPAALLMEYRSRYTTMYDRADLYIPFIERSLRLLTKGGALGFICADRWMKNRYGGPLRALVAEGYHLKVHVDMTDTPAFHAEVTAYPAITVITREKAGVTRLAHRPAIDRTALSNLADLLTAKKLPKDSGAVRELAGVTAGSEPWILESADQLAVVRRLERDFPAIEAAGCKVGIGVATGADQAFIGLFDGLDVEDDRKEPLVMTRDIVSGSVEWRGYGVINPFSPGGGLVELADYPRLKRYLEARKDEIARRHCARKAPANWFRTIDRITPSLTKKPKLLIPDIKGEAHIVYEDGSLYPHHNLYFITSDEWDLRALQAVLLSGIARLFVATYSTKMRGGFLRFQAQYLRRIRVPSWKDVPAGLRRELRAAAEAHDLTACNRAAFKLYGLTAEEKEALGAGVDQQH